MATTTEIRQKLIQGGMDAASAQSAAQILADPTPVNPPTGGIWDTLRAKGFGLSQRYSFGSYVLRIITDGNRTVLVITQNGINQLYVEGDIAKL
jgi:hypothetical protein